MTVDRVNKSAPKNIKNKRGGSRIGSGRPQRKPLPWPKDIDLKSILGLEKLLRHMIEKTWCENVLDPRTIGAINNSIKILIALRNWNGELYVLKDPVEDDVETKVMDPLGMLIKSALK